MGWDGMAMVSFCLFSFPFSTVDHLIREIGSDLEMGFWSVYHIRHAHQDLGCWGAAVAHAMPCGIGGLSCAPSASFDVARMSLCCDLIPDSSWGKSNGKARRNKGIGWAETGKLVDLSSPMIAILDHVDA